MQKQNKDLISGAFLKEELIKSGRNSLRQKYSVLRRKTQVIVSYCEVF